MNTKHTPGPWHTRVYHGEAVRDGVAVYGDGITVVRDIWGRTLEQSAANAALIAAAPDMLAALEWVAHTSDDCNSRDAARAAIAKATGVQS